jgi:hypothetical protein
MPGQCGSLQATPCQIAIDGGVVDGEVVDGGVIVGDLTGCCTGSGGSGGAGGAGPTSCVDLSLDPCNCGACGVKPGPNQIACRFWRQGDLEFTCGTTQLANCNNNLPNGPPFLGASDLVSLGVCTH